MMSIPRAAEALFETLRSRLEYIDGKIREKPHFRIQYYEDDYARPIPNDIVKLADTFPALRESAAIPMLVGFTISIAKANGVNPDRLLPNQASIEKAAISEIERRQSIAELKRAKIEAESDALAKAKHLEELLENARDQVMYFDRRTSPGGDLDFLCKDGAWDMDLLKEFAAEDSAFAAFFYHETESSGSSTPDPSNPTDALTIFKVQPSKRTEAKPDHSVDLG